MEQADIVDRITEALEKEPLSPQKRFMMPLSIPLSLPRSPTDYARIAARAPAATQLYFALSQCREKVASGRQQEFCYAAFSALTQLPILYDPSVLKSGPLFVTLVGGGFLLGGFSLDESGNIPAVKESANIFVSSLELCKSDMLIGYLLVSMGVVLGYGAVDAYKWYQGRSASDATPDGTTPQVSSSATDASLLPAYKEKATAKSNSQNTAPNESETPPKNLNTYA